MFLRQKHVVNSLMKLAPGSIKKGGSDSEVIICFSTKLEVSADLSTVIESYNGFGIYLSPLS